MATQVNEVTTALKDLAAEVGEAAYRKALLVAELATTKALASDLQEALAEANRTIEQLQSEKADTIVGETIPDEPAAPKTRRRAPQKQA